MTDDERYERGRATFLRIHDEKALAAVVSLVSLGWLPTRHGAFSTLKNILAERGLSTD